MTYTPHQFLTPEQIAEMDAQNAPQPKVTKKEAMQALDDARAMFECGRMKCFVTLERFFKGE